MQASVRGAQKCDEEPSSWASAAAPSTAMVVWCPKSLPEHSWLRLRLQAWGRVLLSPQDNGGPSQEGQQASFDHAPGSPLSQVPEYSHLLWAVLVCSRSRTGDLGSAAHRFGAILLYLLKSKCASCSCWGLAVCTAGQMGLALQLLPAQPRPQAPLKQLGVGLKKQLFCPAQPKACFPGVQPSGRPCTPLPSRDLGYISGPLTVLIDEERGGWEVGEDPSRIREQN